MIGLAFSLLEMLRRSIMKTHLYYSNDVLCRYVNDVVTCSGEGVLDCALVRESGFYPSYTTAEIKAGITGIGNNAFKFCWVLSSVSLPMGLRTIQREAFGSCNITSIMIPSSVTFIDSTAFNDCKSLVNFETSDDTGDYTSIDGILYYKVTTIAFVGCGRGRDEELVIPGDVATYISSSACRYNLAATITISEGIQGIGTSALYRSKMHTLNLPSTVSQIELSSIGGCLNLKTVNLHEDNPNMRMYEDSFCQYFGKVNSDNEFVSILWIAQWSTAITIPKHVSGLAAVFQQCQYLTTIVSESDYIKVSDDGLILKSEASKGDWSRSYYASGSLVNAVIGDDIKYLNGNTFHDCALLETVKLHSGILEIGQSVFRCCPRLRSIDFNGCKLTFPEMMFEYCTSLTEISGWGLNDECTIEACAFRNTGLVTFEIPEGVTTIKQRGFIESMYLEKVIMPSSLKVIEEQAFYSSPKLSEIEFQFNSALTTIESFAFGCCEFITSVILPGTVTSLDSRAFGGDWDLTEVLFMDSMGTYRFERVVYEKSGDNLYHKVVLAPPRLSGTFSLPQGTKVIGACAFHHCEGLTSIFLGTSITHIETNAFSQCKMLESILFGGALEYIGRGAFFGTNLREFGYCGIEQTIVLEDSDPFPTNPNISTHLSMKGELFCGHEYRAVLDDTCAIPPTRAFTESSEVETDSFWIKSLQFCYILVFL